MKAFFEFHEYVIPDHMAEGLRDYVNHGREPGHFLAAVLENDLVEAAGKADFVNMANLPAFAAFLYNYAPRGYWGSREAVREWVQAGGLQGMGHNPLF